MVKMTWVRSMRAIRDDARVDEPIFSKSKSWLLKRLIQSSQWTPAFSLSSLSIVKIEWTVHSASEAEARTEKEWEPAALYKRRESRERVKVWEKGRGPSSSPGKGKPSTH